MSEAIHLLIRTGETVVRVRTFRQERVERRLYRVLGLARSFHTHDEQVVLEALEGPDAGTWECYGLAAYAQGFHPLEEPAAEPEPVSKHPPRKVAGAFTHGSGV